MIRRFTFVRRAVGQSVEGFHAAWRARHLAALDANPALRSGVLHWELLHRLDEDYARSREATEREGLPWDGVSVQSVADEAALAALDAALSASTLAAGRDSDLLAPARSSVLTAEPTVIVERPGGKQQAGLRLSAILHRNAAFDLPAFHQHWREHHGGLYRNVPALSEPVLHYDQNHGLDLPGAEFDGVTEQWFASLEAWVESICVPEQSGLIDPDVACFLEPASISYVLSGKPTVLVG